MAKRGWTLLAQCRGLETDIFFPTQGDYETLQYAKSICARCPVTQECLAWALSHNVAGGIWGGISERERLRMRRHPNDRYLGAGRVEKESSNV